jgi:very-short-patch-repair endonuclease
MARHGIPRQRTAPVKVERAKELRRNMTEAERLLWHHVRGNRLNGLHFYRQYVVAGFIVDFYCPAARVVVEVDGSIHTQQVESDAERDQVLAGWGLHVLRVTNDEVMQSLTLVLERIAAACVRRRS